MNDVKQKTNTLGMEVQEIFGWGLATISSMVLSKIAIISEALLSYLRLSFCKVPKMFSLVRDVFSSFVNADSKACTSDGFWAKYERPA